MMHHTTVFGCKRIRSYDRNSHISILWALTVTLTLKGPERQFWGAKERWKSTHYENLVHNMNDDL